MLPQSPDLLKRIPAALWIWYRGGNFRGFQRQTGGPTVQEALEEALAAVGVPATVMPSGRTDRGVHARMQVVSVRLERETRRGARGAAARPPAPGPGAVRGAPAPGSFHAQWSASGKAYRYRLQLDGTPRRGVGALCPGRGRGAAARGARA